MTIIALGCGQRNVHNFRGTTLSEYIKTLWRRDAVQLILSGGATAGRTVSEAETFHTHLQKRGIPENVEIFLEKKSTDTAKNIRYSLMMILEQNIQTADTIEIFTNRFHAERTLDFAHYIRDTEFPELSEKQFEIICAEDFATESQKRHLCEHSAWKNLIQKFREWEERWLAKPVSEREYNAIPRDCLMKKPL